MTTVWCEDCGVLLETVTAPDNSTQFVPGDDRVAHRGHTLRVQAAQSAPERPQGAHVWISLTPGIPWLGWCVRCARSHAWARLYDPDRPGSSPLGLWGDHEGRLDRED